MDIVKLAGLKANEFDVEFIMQMIPHHEGAIEMSTALKPDDNYAELQNCPILSFGCNRLR